MSQPTYQQRVTVQLSVYANLFHRGQTMRRHFYHAILAQLQGSGGFPGRVPDTVALRPFLGSRDSCRDGYRPFDSAGCAAGRHPTGRRTTLTAFLAGLPDKNTESTVTGHSLGGASPRPWHRGSRRYGSSVIRCGRRPRGVSPAQGRQRQCGEKGAIAPAFLQLARRANLHRPAAAGYLEVPGSAHGSARRPARRDSANLRWPAGDGSTQRRA